MGRNGCLVFFLILIVSAIVGYDQYRIEQMRSELVAISNKLHIESDKKSASGNKTDLVTTLAQAELHTKQAKKLIAKKKTAEAQAELDLALKNLKAANNVSTDMVGSAANFVGKAKDNAVDVFQKAWKDISEESKDKKK